MILGIAAILQGNIYLMYGVLTLMGAEAALFSPARMGCLPEIVRADRLSAANGLMGLTTIVAIIGGTVAGGMLFSLTGPGGGRHWGISAAALLGVALAGLAGQPVHRPAAGGQSPPAASPVTPSGQTCARPGHAGGQPRRCCWRPWPAPSTGSWPPAPKSTSIAWPPSAWAWTSSTSATCWPRWRWASAWAAPWPASGRPARSSWAWSLGPPPAWPASCLLLYCVPAGSGQPAIGRLPRQLPGAAGPGLLRRLLRRPAASLLAAPLAAAVARGDPGGLQLHHLLRHVAGRRTSSGSSAKYSTSPPGKSSCCGGLATLPVVVLQCPCAGPGGRPLRHLAADAAGLSGARRRAWRTSPRAAASCSSPTT